MDRGASANVLTELAKDQMQVCHLVSVETAGGTIYMTDSFTTITYDSNPYVPLGGLLGISEIDESSTLAVSSVTVTLTGVDQSYIAAFLSNNYVDRDVFIYKAFLDSSSVLVDDPIQIFSGRIDKPLISEDPDGKTSTIGITATNHWVDFERMQFRSTSHESQTLLFPGDLFFSFATEVNKEIFWGRERMLNDGQLLGTIDGPFIRGTR